jgi:hypothetical protein
MTMEQGSLIEQVWNRATKVNGYDGSTWRTDPFGSPILWADYGNKGSRYGWVLRRLRNGTPARENCAQDFDAVQWQNT